MLYYNSCNMSTLEIEVKFFLEDMETVRQRLQQAGARSEGRFFEYNICFENAAQDLHKTKSLLRLRKDNKTSLTYKTKPNGIDTDFKVLKELEVAISDFDTMVVILKALGFHREQVYEKYRETFTLGSTKICLDSMPYGNFLEIEGQKDRDEKKILSEAYRQAEEIMGMADANAITTYAEAYSEDPEFYSFLETLKSYEANLGKGSVLIMSSESDYLKYLKSWGKKKD